MNDSNPISHEKLQNALDFKPHAAQEEMIKSIKDPLVICAGRRTGKTMYASYEVTREAIRPDKKSRIWIAAPNYELTQIVFDETIRNLGKLFGGDDEFSVKKKPIPTIKLKDGTLIECKSGQNAEGMLGRSTDLVVIDEASRISADVWFQYLKPTTHDRGARTIMISTPTGMNWFYDLWLDNDGLRFPSYANPYFPEPGLSEEEREQAIENIKTSVPKSKWRQEYEADFVEGAGQVFRGISEISVGSMKQPEEGAGYIMGVDIGKHNDYTAIVIANRSSKDVVWVDKFNATDYNVQKDRIIALARKYNNAKVMIDSSGVGDPIVDDIKTQVYVEPVSFHSIKTKQQIIEKLSLYIEQQLITIPEHEDLIKELRQYSYKKTNNDYTKYSAPKGKHDDLVMALALVVWGLRPGGEDDKDDDRPRLTKTFNEYR